MCSYTYTHRKEIIMGDKNKSGYELRTEVLGMAIGILEQRINQQLNNEHFKPEGQRNFVNPYSTEDVLEVAEKLLAFVEKK